MSKLSAALGLDRHPATLAKINAVLAVILAAALEAVLSSTAPEKKGD